MLGGQMFVSFSFNNFERTMIFDFNINNDL